MEIEKFLSSFMKKERFFHVLKVKEIALDIAKFYNIDKEKLGLLSLLHDIAKDIGKKEAEKIIENGKIILDEIEKKEPSLWHGKIGAFLVEERFNIKDPEILEAIRYHSTGSNNMSLMFKILYISDYLESCPSSKIKGASKRDIDASIKMVVAKKIEYVLKKGSPLHPRSVELWNSIS